MTRHGHSLECLREKTQITCVVCPARTSAAPNSPGPPMGRAILIQAGPQIGLQPLAMVEVLIVAGFLGPLFHRFLHRDGMQELLPCALPRNRSPGGRSPAGAAASRRRTTPTAEWPGGPACAGRPRMEKNNAMMATNVGPRRAPTSNGRMISEARSASVPQWKTDRCHGERVMATTHNAMPG